MASLTEFIERRLRLKVNKTKSAVARPEDRHFLGFRLRLDPHTGTVEVLLSERSKRNAMQKVKQLTPRTWGSTLFACISQINAWLRGWHGFFGIVSASEMQALRKIDAHLRRRLRAIQLRHWNANERSHATSSSWASSGTACGVSSTRDGSPGGR